MQKSICGLLQIELLCLSWTKFTYPEKWKGNHLYTKSKAAGEYY